MGEWIIAFWIAIASVGMILLGTATDSLYYTALSNLTDIEQIIIIGVFLILLGLGAVIIFLIKKDD